MTACLGYSCGPHKAQTIQLYAFPPQPFPTMASGKAVTARVDTIFKKDAVGSEDLESSEKVLVKAGARFPVNAITPIASNT